MNGVVVTVENIRDPQSQRESRCPTCHGTGYVDGGE
jgi:hypothetical protein